MSHFPRHHAKNATEESTQVALLSKTGTITIGSTDQITDEQLFFNFADVTGEISVSPLGEDTEIIFEMAVRASEKLSTEGSFHLQTRKVTTTTFSPTTQCVILVDDDTAGSDVTLSFPDGTLALWFNATFYVKKLGTTANVILDMFGAQTIEGATTLTLTQENESVRISNDAVTGVWYVIS